MFDIVNSWIYILDGIVPKIKVFKGRITKTERWAPIVFYTMEYYQKNIFPHKKRSEQKVIQGMLDSWKKV